MLRIRLLAVAALIVCAAALLPSAASAARQRSAVVDDRYIVVFERSVESAAAETDQRERRQGFRARFVYRRAVEGFAAKLTPAQVRKLRADPEVAFVSPDREVHALGALASGDSAPSGVRRIGAGSATAAHDASGANVAVIDSGVDLDHPDLNAVDGKNCVTPGSPADDDNGHGTHVAGTIAARNDGAGVVGVAPGTKVFAVKVLDAAGSGSWSQIICGIDWATATRADADPANDVAVVNMSLGGPGTPVGSCATTTDALHKAVCRSTDAGVNHVVAAGNDGWDFDYASQPDVPAAYPQVLTVTAAGDSDGAAGGTGAAPGCRAGEQDDRYASFSNYAATAAGQEHVIAGPGVCINSTWPGGGHDTISGTSMASPHVAGAVALCLNEGGIAGPCADDGSTAGVIKTMRDDARFTAEAGLGNGFYGDVLRPIAGRYYGHLANGQNPGGAQDPPTTVKSYKPASYSRIAGSLYSGSLSSLGGDDSSRLQVSSSSNATEVEARATIASGERATLRRLAIDHDGHVSVSGATTSLRVLNVRTGTWQTIDQRSAPTGDRPFWWSTATPQDYVSSTGEVRFRIRTTRYGSFRTRTDLVRFTVEY